MKTNATGCGVGDEGSGTSGTRSPHFRLIFFFPRFYWEWLPGFSGVPGRINKLGGGEGLSGGSVFIGGEFKPPVLVWRNDADTGPSTTSEFVRSMSGAVRCYFL